MDDFYRYFCDCFKNDMEFIILINCLAKHANVYVFGGFVRDYLYGQYYNFRDIDIVVDVDTYILEKTILDFIPNNKIVRNQFNGYKLILKDLSVDIWAIEETWAIRNGFFSKKELLKTVYLNIDAYAYNLADGNYLDKCNYSVRPEVIDICFEVNPNEELNLARSVVLSKKYRIMISDRIKKKLLEVLNSKDKIIKFLSSQIDHYGKVEASIEELVYIIGKQEEYYA